MVAKGDEQRVLRFLAGLVEAWNRGDAESFADHFTPDADYVTGEGEWLQGRSAIKDRVGAAAVDRGARIEGSISLRVHEKMATAMFRWSARTEGGAMFRGVVSCVVVKQDGRCLIERLQNTDTATDS